MFQLEFGSCFLALVFSSNERIKYVSLLVYEPLLKVMSLHHPVDVATSLHKSLLNDLLVKLELVDAMKEVVLRQKVAFTS